MVSQLLAVEETNSTGSRRLTRMGDNPLSPIMDDIKNVRSLPNNFDLKGKKTKIIDVLNEYPWTASDISKINDLPYITLQEHRNTESAIKRMCSFYLGEGISSAVIGSFATAANAASYITTLFNEGNDSKSIKVPPKGILDVYNNMFPEVPTGLTYKFPFFTKQYVQLGTPMWNEMAGYGEAVGDIASGISNIAKTVGMRYPLVGLAGLGLEALTEIGSATMFLGKAAMGVAYPTVGIKDRPRYFSSHSNRTISIEFPLYNTLHPEHWEKNKAMIDMFMMQNLYAKRDYITGTPPAYYRVLAPGQYFCYAASLANFQVKNLGNIRMMESNGKKHPVPDAYQISITLNEMVIPSLNQQQALYTGEAESSITSTLKPSQSFMSTDTPLGTTF